MNSLKLMKLTALFLTAFAGQAMASNTAVMSYKAELMQANAKKMLVKATFTRKRHLAFDIRMLISSIRNFRAAMVTHPSRFMVRNRVRLIGFRLAHLNRSVTLQHGALTRLVLKRDLNRLHANLDSLRGSVRRYARRFGTHRFYGYNHYQAW